MNGRTPSKVAACQTGMATTNQGLGKGTAPRAGLERARAVSAQRRGRVNACIGASNQLGKFESGLTAHNSSVPYLPWFGRCRRGHREAGELKGLSS